MIRRHPIRCVSPVRHSVPVRRVVFLWHAILAASSVATVLPALVLGEEPGKATQQELMAARGLVRYQGGWRTAQEIDLIERGERANLARKEWIAKLDRLRRRLDQPAESDAAAEEIREIADPFAVPALAAALAREPVLRVRGWYVESLSRIRSSDALGVLVATALDHA